MTSSSGYNYIYKVLVEDDKDILGIIAYSLYKRQKIEFISAFKDEHGEEPEDADLECFHQISNSPLQIESYRSQATTLAQKFLEASLEQQSLEIERFYANEAERKIREYKPGFFKGVWQSVVGSVFFVLLLGLLVFFAWSANQGFRQVIEHVFNVDITDRKSTSQSVSSFRSPSFPVSTVEAN